MTKEELKLEIIELKESIDKIMEFIVSTDKITNTQFISEEGISDQTLYNWFKRGCPRIDNRHVSRRDVRSWKKENATHKTAKSI